MKKHRESSPQTITEALLQQAVAVWGPERAEELRLAMGQIADHLWTLSQYTLDVEVEPAFFL